MIEALAVVALVVAATLAFFTWRAWRALRRELTAITTRVADRSDEPEPPRGIDVVFEHLERTAGAANAEALEAQADRDRLYEALRVLTDGVIVVDAGGAVLLRNEAAERYHSARHADALAEKVVGDLLDRARRGESSERELQLFGPPREDLLVRAVPLRDSRGIIGAVVVIRDITEARRTESVRRDFVANVSHELKTPIGALSLLAETMAAGDDPTVMHQLAERVLREADRLGRIIDDLLDLSLIEAQEAPTREPVPVHVVMNEAAERVRAQAEAGGVPLEVGPVAEDLLVLCDRRQIVSAITNLLDNAVKYSEATQPIEITGSVEEDRLAITVRDHGIGIPSRDQERIFERFYRVDRARSRATGGTGLGLSIVRHVAQAHGGDVTVESHEGEGSAFRITLPLVTRAGRDPAVAPRVREAS